MTNVPEPSKKIVCIALVVGVIVRLLTAAAGDNYDMESWWIASEAALRGESIYTATHRYNYGPLWSYIIGGLRWLSGATGPDTITRLHLFMTGFLTLADLFLAYALARSTSSAVGVLFFLNPISCFVTGYHIQFDTLAIALGIASWMKLTRTPSRGALITAGILFGVSLSMKHIFSLFIAWLPFITSIRSLKERVAYGSIALTIFISSFLPWIGDPEAWASIQRNVFGYTSTEGHSLTSYLSAWCPLPPRPLFMGLTIAAGILLSRARHVHRFAPQLYLIALPALASGMARNYLAIPLFGIFTFLFARAGLAYLLVATLAFVTVNEDLGTTEVALHLLSTPLVSYSLCQALLLITLGEVYLKTTSPRPETLSTGKIRRGEPPRTPSPPS